jgi:pimeloyl-ACP methyl ester carboxylesterase
MTEETGPGRAGVDAIRLKSGRQVALRTLAQGSSGRTIVFCHPAPGAGSLDPDPRATAARDVTLVALDRPGYGGSEPVPSDEWATVAGAADDLAEVLDARGIAKVGVAGWSAGGRVALALAARRPDLVDRVVVIATPAPDVEVPWVPPDYRAGLESLRGMAPPRALAGLSGQLRSLVPDDPSSDGALALLGAGDDPEAERSLALPGIREALAVMLAEAFVQGAAGLASDIAAYSIRPWGFEPEDVRAKVLLLYGARDPIAGNRHASWWQKRLPDARVEMRPGAGHLLVFPTWSRALSHLAPSRDGP